jgi:hypothetical protein
MEAPGTYRPNYTASHSRRLRAMRTSDIIFMYFLMNIYIFFKFPLIDFALNNTCITGKGFELEQHLLHDHASGAVLILVILP